MDTLRQRIPFKLSEDNGLEETRVLDEQEQEEVIEGLRKDNHRSIEYHYKFLQGCLSFMIFFHMWFLITPRQVTPIHVLLPNSRTPRPSLIPFATFFAWLNIVLLLNVVLYLPKELSLPRVILSVIFRTVPYLPTPVRTTLKHYLPLPTPWIMGVLSLPLFVSILTLSDLHQIFWWSSPLVVVGISLLAMSWIRENESEIEKLEKLRYLAKGA